MRRQLLVPRTPIAPSYLHLFYDIIWQISRGSKHLPFISAVGTFNIFLIPAHELEYASEFVRANTIPSSVWPYSAFLTLRSRSCFFHVILKLNKSIQGVVYGMVKDDSDIAAKKSLDIMVHLYRKRIWVVSLGNFAFLFLVARAPSQETRESCASEVHARCRME